MTKVCSKCEVEKNENEFYKDASHSDGLRSYCKLCRKSPKVLEKEDLYAKGLKKCPICKIEKDLSLFYKNCELRDGRQSICTKCQSNRLKEKNKDPLIREQYKQYNKQRYAKNKEYVIAYQKQYNKEHPEIGRKYSANYRQKNRLRVNLSTTLANSLKSQNCKKQGSCMKYFNFTIEQLKTHLESQYDENMNWDNYVPYWHIDHIIPQSVYDFSDMAEIHKCWNLQNLRPLEASENISKGDTLDNKLIQNYEISCLLPKSVV